MRIVLHINQVHVGREQAWYTCYGLGSCIGLFISDRTSGLSGGAHIPLPLFLPGEFKSAHELIDQLMERLKSLGSDLQNLRAKIVGGGQLYPSALEIGKENAKAVRRLLINRKVFLAAADVGGNVSRTACFNTRTGEIHIITSEQKKYII